MIENIKHILVVDDEEINTALFGKMIRYLGYRVTVCVDSVKALAMVTEAPDRFDMVLADQTMPQLTGAELCYEIKKVNSKIPFVIITGTANMDFELLRDAGVKEVILKPVRLNAIKDTISKYLEDTE
jgi:CheY-like chemotaxis protein